MDQDIIESKEALAIFGGTPAFTKPLPVVNTMGLPEKEAVCRVIDSGVLSAFVGRFDDRFYGGTEVQAFEQEFRAKYNVKHAVSFNSATTALHGAVAAAGIGPGDEVITSPYTMTATPSAVLMNGAVPIFADISAENFCLDPADVERKITQYTKAILVVNLFGYTPDFDALLSVAKKYNLLIIEDCAQAPGATYNGRLAGTIGDIGVFSYNFHKTMQCGEGGVLVTNNDRFAFRAQLMRNHGEVVIDEMEELDPRRQEILLGNNYRMTELHAAVAREQLKKIDFLTEKRIDLAHYLRSKLMQLPGLGVPPVRENCRHVYYIVPFYYDAKYWRCSRKKFVDALKAEGAPVGGGYVKPLYLIPMYQRKKVFNHTQFPFVSQYYQGNPNYSKGCCPVVEDLYQNTLLTTNLCQYPREHKHVDLFISAIKKLLRNKETLMG